LNKLVEEIIKPILEANGIKKVIGIYGGRFQPFGPHHYKTYKWLQSKVDEAYITTSNIKKPPRHPMNFKEKVRHMTKMGVKSKYIIEEKSPYVAKNLEKKYDKNTTAFVYVFGAKDAGRLGGGGKYFQDYLKNKKNLKGYGENGYYLVAPHVSISVGGKEVSGTTMRELLGSDKFDDKQRVKLFKKMFGYYDKGVFTMMSNKFKKLFEINEGLPTKVTDKYKKMKMNSPTEKKKFKQFLKHHRYHSGPHIDGLEAEPETYDFDDNNDSKAGVQKRKKDKIKRGYEPVRENDVIHTTWDNTKPKPKNPKLFDKKKRDLLFDLDLPIKVGDTIMMGRFKNKKVIIKSIDFNEKGDLIINGRPALKFRIIKSKEIDEFLIHNDIGKIFEVSNTTNAGGIQGVDSGPSLMFKNSDHYKGRGNEEAEKLGWTVINYILQGDVDNLPPDESELLDGWPIGPHNSVSYLPAGIGTGKTPNNQENLTGTKGYDKWFRSMRTKAEEVGMELMKFTKQDKDTRKQIAKDTVDTIKQQEKEEVEENVFTKQWWGDVLNEVSAKTKKFKQKLMRRGIVIRYDKAKAQKDLEQKYAGQGEVVGKKFGLRKAYYAVPKKGFKKDTKPTITITKKEMDKLHTDKQIDKGNLKVLYKEGLILEGGAYGHMAHPFDDKELTFGDLKKIIELGLGGQLNREDNVTEKLDGQNIMVSFKDGKLIAARNKGHIKNGGKTALDKKGIASKFKGRGSIRNAFVFAMNDLEKAIKSLSDKQRDKIFNNGYNFMNLEVMYPSSANVIDYDVTQLIFHGALIYDDKGNVKGEVPGSGRILAGMIQQRNQNIQKKYSIGKPVFLDVPKHQDFGKMKDKFLGRLNKLKAEYGLKDNDTLGLYHQMWWEHKIYQTFGSKNLSGKLVQGLVKRWAFFDKSYSVADIKKDMKRFIEANPKKKNITQEILDFDKTNHKQQVKKNMKPFEELFFEVGAEILKNVKGFISANPKKSVQGVVKRLDKAINVVKSGGDVKKLKVLKQQLDKLNAIGGTKSIVPSEGLVFKYKGKTYKFTGAFAPINQITGLIYF